MRSNIHSSRMAALTIQQRTLIGQLYFQNNNFTTLTHRAFRRINGPAYAPSSRTVRAIITHFENLEPPMTDTAVDGLDTQEG